MGAGCDLSVTMTGPEDGEPVVLVHGMRDHALSMLFVQDALPGHRLIMPDLRGHGESDSPGVYGFNLFLADLRAVFNQFVPDKAVLVGHSLGGHLSTRFTSFFPDKVSKLVLMDGMGPPRMSEEELEVMDENLIRHWGELIDTLLEPVRTHRVMQDLDAAKARFRRNNPLLGEATLELLVTQGVKPHGDGLIWKWDPGVESIWSTFSGDEGEKLMGLIQCEVLIMTGEHGLDYWTAHRESLKGADDYYQSELKRREDLFHKAESVVIPGAGHMLQYDQPAATAEAIAAFIRR